MPFKSKAQRGKIFELEKQGKIKPGTAAKFQSETPPGKLPDYAPGSKSTNAPKIKSVADITKFRKGKFGE